MQGHRTMVNRGRRSGEYPRWVQPQEIRSVGPTRGTTQRERRVAAKQVMEMANLREVAPGIYVGSQWAVPLMGWALVVSVGGAEMHHQGANLRWFFEDGDPVPDGLMAQVEEQVRARIAHGPVLIHCAAGLSRSPSVAYGVLRRLHGLDHDTALGRVQVPGHEGRYPLKPTLGSVRAWLAGEASSA